MLDIQLRPWQAERGKKRKSQKVLTTQLQTYTAIAILQKIFLPPFPLINLAKASALLTPVCLLLLPSFAVESAMLAPEKNEAFILPVSYLSVLTGGEEEEKQDWVRMQRRTEKKKDKMRKKKKEMKQKLRKGILQAQTGKDGHR